MSDSENVKAGNRKSSSWFHKHSDGCKFILKTVIYSIILLILVYLYDYSGVSSTHFIYNEF